MIEFPANPSPNGAAPSLLDYGFQLRGSLGGSTQRVDRAGSRFSVQVSYPPMPAQTARVFVSRLLTAKREGIRIEYPLLEQSQGIPGSPVMDGAGQRGTSIDIRGLTPSYGFKEGFWLTLIDADGVRYLHNCRSNEIASGTGTATITIEPPIRADFADGATVLLAKPEVEGFVDGSAVDWQIPIERLIALSFTLEEQG